MVITKSQVRYNFSRCADQYDKYALVQKQCASWLLRSLKINGPRRILDIGCGTGTYTRMLVDRFPKAKIDAFDLAKPMIKQAEKKLSGKQVNLKVADVKNFKPDQQYDLITSNASFQWFDRFDLVLKQCRQMMGLNSVLAISVFGPKTYQELGQVVKTMPKNQNLIAAGQFYSLPQVKTMISKVFDHSKITTKNIKRKYLNLYQLLQEIKHTGTRGQGIISKGVWTPGMIKQIESEYKQQFGDICASFEIFICVARR